MSSSSSPCAACKLLRRKCTQGCVFAPYFPPDQPSKFANVHRVFGASNVAKLLNDLPPAQREDAVNSLAYEADARLRDPVYGCVAYISILQLKIKQVREDLAAARKELANYVGPAAFAPFHPAAAATAGFVGPHQYQGTQYGVAGVGLAGVGIASPAAQHAHAHAHMMQQQQHMVEAQQMAAAVEVAAREQEMMMRQAAAYGHAATAGAATVAVMPSGSAEAYEGASFLVPQQSPQAAGAAVAATYRVEPSPPTTQSNSHVERPQAQQQRAGSDEASGGVAPPA